MPATTPRPSPSSDSPHRRPLSNMKRYPTEILCYIFAEACTDDGQTGCALGLVSKRFRAVSRRHALQSVALYGAYQLSAFAAHLDSLPPCERRVRNLFLTDRRRVSMEYHSGQDRTEWLQERLFEDFRIMDPSREYSPAGILRIFQHVAKTLRTCTLLLFDRYTERALPMPFVALEELTIYGSLLNYYGTPSIPSCPALRRLHVIQDFAVRRSLPSTVARAAPTLTHLRISRLAACGLGTEDILPGLKAMVQARREESKTKIGLPPTLEHVIIQMSQQELRSYCGMPSVYELLASPTANQLKDIALRDKSRRVVLLKPQLWSAADGFAVLNTDVQFYMDIKKSWEERVKGSEGMWEVDQGDILASYGYCTEEKWSC